MSARREGDRKPEGKEEESQSAEREGEGGRGREVVRASDSASERGARKASDAGEPANRLAREKDWGRKGVGR